MGRHRAAALTAVLIAAFVAFPSVGVGQDTSGDDVPMFRGNPGRSGVQPGPGPEANVDQLWRFQTGAAIQSSPVVVGGAVYLGSMDGNVYAVDAATGTELWRFSTSDRVVSSPAIADGTVYVGSNDDYLYALDAATGQQRWRFRTNADVTSSPVVVDGTVYVGSDGLYAVDASSGRQRWRFPAQTPVRSSPAVIDGTVYIASGVGIDDVYLHAIDAVTGQARWSRGGSRTGGGGLRAYLVPQSDPSVANGAVHIVEMDCGAEVAGACLVAFSLAAVDVVAGTERWRRFVYETQAPIGMPGGFTAPAVTTGFAYVGYSKGTDVLSQLPDGVQAFNAQTGAPRWFFPTEGGVGSSLTVADGVLYFGSDDNYVYAVDAVNGGERWRYRTQDAVRSSPAVIDGIVYVGSDDGVLYAIGGPGSSIDATATAGPASTVAPPGTTPIAPLTDGQIRPGITVEVNDDDVVLRDAPSLDSEIVATLRRGTELIVIGPSEEGDGHIWWPVAEPSTGRVGYVRETFLTVKD